MTRVLYRPHGGKYVAPGWPPINPGGGTQPPNSDLVYGTTLIGQSYDSYEQLGTNTTAYDQAEHDLFWTVDGVLRRGGAVIRRYNGDPGTWSGNTIVHMRSGQPVCYSFKADTGDTDAQFKTKIRNWLDSKPTNSPHCFLVYWHEPDDDIRGVNSHGMDGVGSTKAARLAWWQNRNHLVRDVLNEAAYSARTDVSFGPIYTIVPYQTTTTADRWENYYAGMTGVWDWMGIDCYNFAWDGDHQYADISKIMGWMNKMNNATGLNCLVGECGSPRPTQATGTRAAIDARTAQWTLDFLNAFINCGYCEAAMWWRRPALTGPSSPFSTIMATPPGYDPNTDAQVIVDAWSQKAAESIVAATPTIPWWT